MNYSNLYSLLVANRQTNVLLADYEAHHIIPRCLGGSDDASNLVKLTYREHLIAHVLLSKMYPDSWGLSYAVYMMCAKGGTTSRAYDASKRTYLEKHRERTLALWQDPSYIEKQSFRTSDEFRQHMSTKMKQVYVDNPEIIDRMKATKATLDYSLIWTAERKLSLSNATKGLKKPDGFSESVSRRMKGVKKTDSQIAKFVASRVGKGTGDRNSMSSEENRAKVGLSKIGRKMVCIDGVRRYITADEYSKIKDEITVIGGKLHYTTQ